MGNPVCVCDIIAFYSYHEISIKDIYICMVHLQSKRRACIQGRLGNRLNYTYKTKDYFMLILVL